jgi:hypothetical protein
MKAEVAVRNELNINSFIVTALDVELIFTDAVRNRKGLPY